jgi:MerR family mercuric resistance operon transcriptional regulator
MRDMAKPPAPGRPLTRKGLADRAGCGIETVRYYEDAGLMPEPDRGPNGYRLYGQEDVRRLGFIGRARRLGLTIEEVRGLLSLVDGERVTCADVRETTLRYLDGVRARIAELRRLERTLADVSARCSGEEVPDCAVIDALMDG